MALQKKARKKVKPKSKKNGIRQKKKIGFFESLFGSSKKNKIKIKKKIVKRSKNLIKKSRLKTIKLKKIKMAKLKAAKLEKASELRKNKLKKLKEAKLEKMKKLKAIERAVEKLREKRLKAKLKVKKAKVEHLKKEKEQKIKLKTTMKVEPDIKENLDVGKQKKKPGFFESLFGAFKDEENIKKEVRELKKKGKIKDKFEEEYEIYLNRKGIEREEPEHKKINKMPTLKQIKRRALPVAYKHEKKLIEELEKKKIKKGLVAEWMKTGVPGFDDLFEKGIPKGSAILIAGGAGSGKTIFCLETLIKNVSEGKKCFYMSFEESEERLVEHMKDFGWDAEKYIKSGLLKIKRYSPFDVTRSVEAMLAKEKGDLLIDLDPVLLPEGYYPDIIVLDSLTAVASAFTGKEDSYRVYIEQLFRFFEKLRTTSFLITETKQIPDIFSTTGVEEFLADGVIVFYNIKRGNIKENAVEVLKMRGEKHQKKIVAMQITDKGIVVYPEQEVFGGIEDKT